MKKIEAVIRPSKLEQVKDALNARNVKGITVTQVVGCGHQKGQTSYYRGEKVEITFLQKLKLEIICDDADVDAIADLIAATARTGEIGDGKIFISSIENAIRIRTGEKGVSAI
jgi:nitrogen regulatory protein P-II 1